MTPSIDELEALARKATPGPWYTVGQPWLSSDCETYVIAGNPDPHAGRMVCDFQEASLAGVEDEFQDGEWSARNDANAAFIAACSPETILALTARVRELEADVVRLNAVITHERSVRTIEYNAALTARAEAAEAKLKGGKDGADSLHRR